MKSRKLQILIILFLLLITLCIGFNSSVIKGFGTADDSNKNKLDDKPQAENASLVTFK